MPWLVGGGYFSLTAFADFGHFKKGRLVAAGFLMGLSAGVKLNYAAFFVFAGAYVFFGACYFKNMDVSGGIRLFCRAALVGVAAFAAGFLISNPIMVTDFEKFKQAYGEASNFSIAYLKDVLFRQNIEWDLVNSGGMTHTIVSLVGLIGVCLGSYLYRGDRPLTLAGICATAVLVAMCCKARFLGWYLMPMIFLLCVITPDSRRVFVVLLINFALMLPDTAYQVTSKTGQIRNVERRESILQTIDEWTQAYPEYRRFVLADVCVDSLPYNFSDEIKTGVFTGEHQIFFISERGRANKKINDIYQHAVQGQNGYELAGEENGLTIVLLEQSDVPQ